MTLLITMLAIELYAMLDNIDLLAKDGAHHMAEIRAQVSAALDNEAISMDESRILAEKSDKLAHYFTLRDTLGSEKSRLSL